MASLLCARNRQIIRLVKTSFLMWLTLTCVMLFLTLQKQNSRTRRVLLADSLLANDDQKLKQDVCFDPNKLKYEIVRQQHEASIWKKTFYRRRSANFEGPVEVDTSMDERKCPELYRIAREMLNGLKVKIPYGNQKTLWKFRERVNLNKLKDTHLRWNNPWEQGNSKKTMELLRRHNVSAKSIKKRKILLSYGHNCCNESKARAIESAINNAKMDYAEALDLSFLSVPFQISHQDHLRWRKGAGYWLWKPYIILDALLNKLNDGDLLVYQDSGMYFVNDIGPLLSVCKDVKPSILTFALMYEERFYSKRDAFILINMNSPNVYAKGQTQRLANLIVAMKNCEAIQYFMEYMAYTMDFRICNDKPNVMGQRNFDGFVGNRHDQTIHSLLSKKWGILELRDPCTCGRNGFNKRGGYASGPYHSLYVHDRKRS